ncbi:MAG: anti-phage protein KwaB [Fidelibacterota bacterium]
MKSEKLNHVLQGLINEENLSLTIYFLLKNGEIRLADVENEILPELMELYISTLEEIIEDDDTDVLALSEADERRNVLYYYDYEEDIDPISKLAEVDKNQEQREFSFSEDKLTEIDGFIFRIANSENSIVLFSKSYPVNIIKQDRSFYIRKSDVRFSKFEDELVRLNGKFDMFYIDEDTFLLKYEILEKFFGFDNVIKNKAAINLKKIEYLNIIEDFDYFKDQVENISFARKLVKVAEKSPVFQKSIQSDKIIEFASNHKLIGQEIQINQSKFVINSKKSSKLLLKLFDDDYLHSKLTDTDYDSLAKDEL